MSGIPYHAWTHRPKEQGGTDPIALNKMDLFRAYLDDIDPVITGLDDTAQTIEWNWWLSGNTDVFFPVGSPLVLGTDTFSIISLQQPGRYTFTVGAKMGTGIINGVNLSLNEGLDPGFGYSEDYMSGPVNNYDNPGIVTWTLAICYPKVTPYADPEDPIEYWPDFPTQSAEVYFTIAADIPSGTRVVDHCFLEITHEPVNFPTVYDEPV